ncbi:ATP-binding protein, partial [Klebsiella pneumoniae]|uniref:ATP-binding protein n=1 Tax=Klebsiella pneumoniae TaxID=573 RepID=UPI00259FE55C
MDKMTMEQIFTPFFTTRENGTGFGLSIAESMITSHRGYITVDSTPGRGSVFTVYLPAAKKADEER